METLTVTGMFNLGLDKGKAVYEIRLKDQGNQQYKAICIGETNHQEATLKALSRLRPVNVVKEAKAVPDRKKEASH